MPDMESNDRETCGAQASDLSQLRRPVDINLSSLRQIAQIFEKGTDEVRDILTYECDIIYECRICRSLFRSLANLISHKRVYCPEKYTACHRLNCDIDKTLIAFEDKENSSHDRTVESRSTRKEPKKDLTSVVDMLMKKQIYNDGCDNVRTEKTFDYSSNVSSANGKVGPQTDADEVTNRQTVATEFPAGRNEDVTKKQTLELENMSSENIVDVEKDDRSRSLWSAAFTDPDNQDDDDAMDSDKCLWTRKFIKGLSCHWCNKKFSTKKGLLMHDRFKHPASQTGFSCPFCSNVFADRWNVYRHLFKVHRKTNAQVRKLRLLIHERPYRRDDSRTEDPEKSHQEAERHPITKEIQEPTITTELETEVHRCDPCGKRFDKKTALKSHSRFCKKRNASLSPKRGRTRRAAKNSSQNDANDVKIVPNVVEKLLSNDPIISMNQTSSPIEITEFPVATPTITLETHNYQVIDNHQPTVDVLNALGPKEPTKIAIQVENVSSLSQDVWDRMGTSIEPIYPKKNLPITFPINKSTNDHENPIVIHEITKKCITNDNPKIPELIYMNIENSRPINLTALENVHKLGIKYRGIQLPTVTLEKINTTRIRTTNEVEASIVSNSSPIIPKIFTPMEKKKLSNVGKLRQFQCQPCNRKFTSLPNLRRHITIHRRRYHCKLCDYKTYLKSDCTNHCNDNHDARGNRGLLNKLIVEVPIDESNENDKFVVKSDELSTKNLDVVKETKKRGRPITKNKRTTDVKKVKKITTKKVRQLKKNKRKTDATMVKEPKTRGRPTFKKTINTKKKMKIRNMKKVEELRSLLLTSLNDNSGIGSEIVEVANDVEGMEDDCWSGVEAGRSRPRSAMDQDPELRKMVMEVIFGPASKEIGINDDSSNPSNDNCMPEGEDEALENGVADPEEDCQVVESDVKILERDVSNRLEDFQVVDCDGKFLEREDSNRTGDFQIVDCDGKFLEREASNPLEDCQVVRSDGKLLQKEVSNPLEDCQIVESDGKIVDTKILNRLDDCRVVNCDGKILKRECSNPLEDCQVVDCDGKILERESANPLEDCRVVDCDGKLVRTEEANDLQETEEKLVRTEESNGLQETEDKILKPEESNGLRDIKGNE